MHKNSSSQSIKYKELEKRTVLDPAVLRYEGSRAVAHEAAASLLLRLVWGIVPACVFLVRILSTVHGVPCGEKQKLHNIRIISTIAQI